MEDNRKKELSMLKEIMDFDTYRGFYPIDMEHGLMRLKYLLVKYHLEWVILLLGPVFLKTVRGE